MQHHQHNENNGNGSSNSMRGWNRIGIVLAAIYMLLAAALLAITGYLTPNINPSPGQLVRLSSHPPHINDSIFWRLSRTFESEVDHPDKEHIRRVKDCRKVYDNQIQPGALTGDVSDKTLRLISLQLKCGSETQLVYGQYLVWNRVLIAFIAIPAFFLGLWLGLVRAISWVAKGFEAKD